MDHHFKVLKVKYGDTLRRFNVCVSGAGKLEMDIAMLKKKITTMFDISSDTDLKLTYIDEDGDVITLVDDDDLHDATRQKINPLRISVLTSTISVDKCCPTSPLSTGSSVSLSNIKSGVEEILKSVPEPLREGVSRLYFDCISKAGSSSPLLAELVENLSTVGHSLVNNTSQPPSSLNSEEKSGVSESCHLPSHKDKEAQMGELQGGEGVRNSEMLVLRSSEADGTQVSVDVYHEEKLNDDTDEGYSEKEVMEGVSMDSNSRRGFMNSSSFNECPFGGLSLVYESTIPSESNGEMHLCHRGVSCDHCGMYPITGPRFRSKIKVDFDLCVGCFVRVGKKDEYYRIDRSTRGSSLNILPKLDARFVNDVSVLDGTEMAPLTLFTKIWKVRNSGTAPWPHGTVLVWTGGNKFSDETSLLIEAPLDGVPAGMELDIVMECRAPEYPGKYISYWRMATPFLHMFGEQLWTSIQVIPSAELPLDVPPSTQAEHTSSQNSLPVMPLDSESAVKEGSQSSEGMVGNADIEEAVLYELADMGFKDVELNREILRMNKYDLDRSVDDLSSTLEWDTIMDDLKEMGFCDEKMNRKLLGKNKGSIKHAVLDLIAAENEFSG